MSHDTIPDEQAESPREEKERANAETARDAEVNEPQRNPEYYDFEDDEDMLGALESTVNRDPETGELRPEVVYVEELESKIAGIRWSDEDRERFVADVFGSDAEDDEVVLSNELLAEMFDKHLVSPNYPRDHPRCPDSGVTASFIRDELSRYKQKWIYAGLLLVNDEYDPVRILRDDLTETELEVALRQMERDDEGFGPQGNRSKNQTRRDRR